MSVLSQDVRFVLRLSTNHGAPRITHMKDFLPWKVLIERLHYVQIHTSIYLRRANTIYTLDVDWFVNSVKKNVCVGVM